MRCGEEAGEVGSGDSPDVPELILRPVVVQRHLHPAVGPVRAPELALPGRQSSQVIPRRKDLMECVFEEAGWTNGEAVPKPRPRCLPICRIRGRRRPKRILPSIVRLGVALRLEKYDHFEKHAIRFRGRRFMPREARDEHGVSRLSESVEHPVLGLALLGSVDDDPILLR